MAGTGKAHLRPEGDVLIRVEDLVVEFPAGRGRTVKAVSGISFDIAKGETLGLVGESGCGKSTTGRALIQLPSPTSGSVRHGLVELTELSDEAMRRRRTDIQMIFQDPISSLNPRRTVGEIVAEPLRVWGPKGAAEQKALVDRILDAVGIDPDLARDKRPHEFSGGQCQRISIARSLVVDPELLICDEPVSALDVSVQAQILNLLEDLKVEYGLTLVFIAHDLAVVKNVSDRVAVMYLGKLCTPPCCSGRSPSRIRRRLSTRISWTTASCHRPSTRRRVAASGPAARRPRNSAPTRNPRCVRCSPATTWPATTRWWP